MRRSLVLALLVAVGAALSGVARADGTEARTWATRLWAVGTRAAVQGTGLSDGDHEMRHGFAIGGVFLRGIDTLAQGGCQFLAEVLLSDKRVARHIEGGTEVVRMRYIDVPLLLRWRVRGGGASPYFVAGPVLSFLVDAHIWIDAPTVQVDRQHHGIASTDVAFQLGIGAEVPLGLATPTLDLRYSHGFGTIADDATGAKRTRVFALSLGILF